MALFFSAVQMESEIAGIGADSAETANTITTEPAGELLRRRSG